ncbi:MAG: 4Fe-4S binding protein [Candidatus Cloacimonetes bacterium]|nr:4Fe-4S binding protein [Candidatus Cloacimonadota bacterium]
MKYRIIQEKCDLCGCCVSVCPADAIRMTEFLANILEDECTGCKNCFIVCPVSAVEEVSDED